MLCLAFGIADQRDHPPLAAILHPAVQIDIILHQRGEERLRRRARRAGGEIDVVGISGAETDKD